MKYVKKKKKSVKKKYVLRWFLLGVLVGALITSSVAFLLFSSIWLHIY
jgi:hypothetical protein